MLSLARYHAVNQLLLLKRLFLQIYSYSLVYPPFSAITRASAGLAVPICTESLHLCNLPHRAIFLNGCRKLPARWFHVSCHEVQIRKQEIPFQSSCQKRRSKGTACRSAISGSAISGCHCFSHSRERYPS